MAVINSCHFSFIDIFLQKDWCIVCINVFSPYVIDVQFWITPQPVLIMQVIAIAANITNLWKELPRILKL